MAAADSPSSASSKAPGIAITPTYATTLRPLLPSPTLDKPSSLLPFRVLLFTMDSLTQYVENAARGGPAGEILIRQRLQAALAALGGTVDVAASDDQFEQLTRTTAQVDAYSLIFLDPWTFVGRGWVPRPLIAGREGRVFLLSFFGMPDGPQAMHGAAIPPRHVLTPYPVPGAGNGFLGYAQEPAWRGTRTGDPRSPSPLLARAEEDARGLSVPPRKLRQGVVWGKQAEYFRGRWPALERLAREARVALHVTLPPAAVPAAAVAAGLIVPHGHLGRDEWRALLASSRLMLGLGDPLSGPSAVDAVASGAVFLNPRYPPGEPKERFFTSQHPFLQDAVGAPYVCSFDWTAFDTLLACALSALGGPDEEGAAPDLPPFIPTELTEAAYSQRVRDIFEPVILVEQRRLHPA